MLCVSNYSHPNEVYIMLKIYFAGSIRGGRTDAALYARLIAHLKERAVVLTEHIGSPNAFPTVEKNMTDAEIYAQDIAWLESCDLVIAECSTPSLGVGYEMAYAEKIGKPVYIFHDSSRGPVSAMLTGAGYFHIAAYDSEQALFSAADAVLDSFSNR